MLFETYENWDYNKNYNQYDIVKYLESMFYIAVTDIPAKTEIYDKSKWLLIYINQTAVNHEKYQNLMLQKSGTIDQTFNPTSTNAVSGKAVAEELSLYTKTSDSGIITIVEGFDIRKINFVITGNIKSPFKAPVASAANAYKTWTGIQIPETYRPLENVFVPIFFGDNCGRIKINTDGSIQQIAPFTITTDMDVRGTISWTV